MEKMQAFIDFIFFKVWCKAPIGLTFSPDLFDKEPDLKEIVSKFGFAGNAPVRGKQFYKDIKANYQLFAVLIPSEIDQLKRWYRANNDIEKVCANDPAVQIARYADITAINPDLSDQLASFFKGLYSQLLDLTALRDRIGKIDDHYKTFMQANTSGKCPFCGIGDIKGIHHSKRDAYDHYLPKGFYPFNSINFQNLVPACHNCNSAYKLGKDPVSTTAGRRKAFYPYASPEHSINVEIELKKMDIERLSPEDIEFRFGPPDLQEEIETWKDLYDIEERYKAKCCGGNDGRYWLQQRFDEWQEDGRLPVDYMQTLARQTLKNPFADNNFLKKAFLEGCRRAGLFDAIAGGGTAP